MRILDLLSDLGIYHQTEGHKHCRPGWVNIACPWCTGNPGLHLGYNLNRDYFVCWRCGWRPVDRTLAALTGLPLREIRSLMRRYGGKSRAAQREGVRRTPRAKGFRLPFGIGDLGPIHRRYLKRRRFGPDVIAQAWRVQGTGPISELDGTDYRHRLLIPIYWEGQVVSFQTRDVTGKAYAKYKACPKDRELIHHKHILYQHPERPARDWGIVVEGVTDVWRLGPKAVATFGINVSRSQIRVLADRFLYCAILFDPEPQAQKEARKLASELRLLGVVADVISFSESDSPDPGDMSDEEAREIMASVQRKVDRWLESYEKEERCLI